MFYLTCASRLIYQRVKNPETTLKQFVSEFYFSFILHVRALEIKHFISVLFQFYFMLCEPF